MNRRGTHSHVLPNSAQIISNILIVTQPGHGCAYTCSPPSSHPLLQKITLRYPTQLRTEHLFWRTARKEAPSLAISWWQQAACHIPWPISPPPTSHVPHPHNPHFPTPHAPIPHPLARDPEHAGDGAGAGTLLYHGVLGTHSTHLHWTLVRSPLTHRIIESYSYGSKCDLRVSVGLQLCNVCRSLWSCSRSELSHTPEITPSFNRRCIRRLTRCG